MGVFGWPWCWFIGRKTHTIPVCSSCLKRFFCAIFHGFGKKMTPNMSSKTNIWAKRPIYIYTQFNNIFMDVICFYTQTFNIYLYIYILNIILYRHSFNEKIKEYTFIHLHLPSVFFQRFKPPPFFVVEGIFPESCDLCFFFTSSWVVV